MMIYPIEIDIETAEFVKLEKFRCKDERKRGQTYSWANNGAILVESTVSWNHAAKIAWEERIRWLHDNSGGGVVQLPSSLDVDKSEGVEAEELDPLCRVDEYGYD